MVLVTSADAERIAHRYPKRTPWDYLLFGGLAAGVGLAIVLATISGMQRSDPPVVSMVRSFTVDAPTQISVELVVQRKDPSQAAECRLVAQAGSYETVGEATVEIPPDTERVKTYTFSVTTVKEPVAIDQQGCRLSQG